MTDRYADLRAALDARAKGGSAGYERYLDKATPETIRALLADYEEAERGLILAGKVNKDLMDAVLELKAERDRLRAAAQMLADWAEHEVGAEPDLTPGLAEVRAALAQEQGGSDGD